MCSLYCRRESRNECLSFRSPHSMYVYTYVHLTCIPHIIRANFYLKITINTICEITDKMPSMCYYYDKYLFTWNYLALNVHTREVISDNSILHYNTIRMMWLEKCSFTHYLGEYQILELFCSQTYTRSRFRNTLMANMYLSYECVYAKFW